MRVIFSMEKKKFSKPFATYSEQLAILQKRGLIVSDTEAAEAFLAYSNYYRFSGYLLAFEDKRHDLFPNTTFENVRHLYEFDRNLRCLVSEAIGSPYYNSHAVTTRSFSRAFPATAYSVAVTRR